MSRPIIAILRGIRPEEAAPIATAILDAGIDRIEVPLNSPSGLESIAILVRAIGSRALVGAGTVMTPEDVADVEKAGGRLVVSPNMDPEVIAETKARGLQSIPGVMTPTECFAAIKAGADGLKLFPGSLVGPKGLRQFRAVLPPELPVYAVGGANPDNFASWWQAGASGFGIGSAIYQPGAALADTAARAAAVVDAFDRNCT